MYTELGNKSEMMIMNELKRIFPGAILENNKTHGTDIKMKICSRNLNIEVKSCKLITYDKTNKMFKNSRFIIYLNDLIRNDIFVFHIRESNTFRIFPTSYLRMMLEHIEFKKGKKRIYYKENSHHYTYFLINEILTMKFFTLRYILNHYCKEPSCSFDCLYCPFYSESMTNHFIKYF